MASLQTAEAGAVLRGRISVQQAAHCQAHAERPLLGNTWRRTMRRRDRMLGGRRTDGKMKDKDFRLTGKLERSLLV